MKSKKTLLALLVGFLVILSSLLGISFYEREDQTGSLGGREEVGVIEVIDGDTIRVKRVDDEKVFRVRYLGIDTPEFEGDSFETCFGLEAEEKNREMVLDKNLLLEFDKDKYDRFGRALAYVWTLNNEGEKESFVNLELLEGGYARFYLDKQNTRYQEEMVETASSAHDEFLGLWGSCGEGRFDGKCVIKGNITYFGEENYQKHYHLPGDKYYSQTKVNLLKEDKWLCTIEEAQSKNFERTDWDK